MRRFLTGFVVAVTTTVVPILALAGNQEVANDIAKGLRESGQLKNYKVGVKYQDGTVWLKGLVQSQDQMNTALKLVFQNPGVTRVVNDLAVDSDTATAGKPSSAELSASGTVLNLVDAERTGSRVKQLSPVQRLERAIRGNLSRPANEPQMSQAQRVPSSFQQSEVQQVSAIERRAVPKNTLPRMADARNSSRPVPVAYMQQAGPMPAEAGQGGPMPAYVAGAGGGVAPARYDQPQLPNYAWPSYTAYPNYAGLTYPRQYSPTAWPYIGPFYPYPQVPLGWRKVTLEWDDGWWMLDFKDR